MKYIRRIGYGVAFAILWLANWLKKH